MKKPTVGKLNTMSIKQILKMRHEHHRDKNLEFEEKWHKYTIITDPTSTYLSVTKLTSFQFPRFDADLVIKRMMSGKNWNEDNKYWGMTPAEIKDMWKNNGATQSGAGTSLHFNIEQFMNQWLVDEKDRLVNCDHQDLLDSYMEDTESGESNIQNTSPEWGYFLNFVKSNAGLTPYRTEWMIYDEDLKLAGSIDMVYKNDDGTLTIYNSANLPHFKVVFENLFPYSLSPLQFDSTLTDEIYLKAQVSFKYTIYNIRDIKCC